MKIETAITEANIPVTQHDSTRRAIERILARSQGKVPGLDLLAILKIVISAL